MPRRKGQVCPPGCQCGLHNKPGTKCLPGCGCGRHTAVRRGPSPETAVKISLSLKGRKRGPLSASTKEKIGAANRVRKHSAEFRERCRQRQLGTGRGHYYDKGYRFLTSQYGHPLSGDNGVVQEHRKVLYDKIGPGFHPCHWCGKQISWGGSGGINVDHLNGVKDDNRSENLVVSCCLCNRIGMRLGKARRGLRSCERCGGETSNARFCSRKCANVR